MKLRTLAAAALAMSLAACASSEDPAESGGAAQQTNDNSNRQVATAPVSQFPPGSQEELNATVGDRVFFDFDRYDLLPEGRATVSAWANWMQQHPNVQVLIEGHADERGTREYNLALGARRANAIKDNLTALGISPARVGTITYGKERPAVLGSNPQAWSQNRRGVAVVQ